MSVWREIVFRLESEFVFEAQGFIIEFKILKERGEFTANVANHQCSNLAVEISSEQFEDQFVLPGGKSTIARHKLVPKAKFRWRFVTSEDQLLEA